MATRKLSDLVSAAFRQQDLSEKTASAAALSDETLLDELLGLDKLAAEDCEEQPAPEEKKKKKDSEEKVASADLDLAAYGLKIAEALKGCAAVVAKLAAPQVLEGNNTAKATPPKAQTPSSAAVAMQDGIPASAGGKLRDDGAQPAPKLAKELPEKPGLMERLEGHMQATANPKGRGLQTGALAAGLGALLGSAAGPLGAGIGAAGAGTYGGFMGAGIGALEQAYPDVRANGVQARQHTLARAITAAVPGALAGGALGHLVARSPRAGALLGAGGGAALGAAMARGSQQHAERQRQDAPKTASARAAMRRLLATKLAEHKMLEEAGSPAAASSAAAAQTLRAKLAESLHTSSGELGSHLPDNDGLIRMTKGQARNANTSAAAARFVGVPAKTDNAVGANVTHTTGLKVSTLRDTLARAGAAR